MRRVRARLFPAVRDASARLCSKNLNAWRVASISTRRAPLAGSTLISPKILIVSKR